MHSGAGDEPPRQTGRDAARSASLRRLHGLVRQVNGDLDLGRTLTAVCRGVVEGLGFGVAVLNLVLPDGGLEVVVCEGSESAGAALLGQRASRQVWDETMALCRPVGDLLVDYEGDRAQPPGGPADAPSTRPPEWVPDLVMSDADDAWRPQDMLLAPLRTPRSGLLGIISVDLPVDGLRPGADQLELLEMYAAQASIALENATLHTALTVQDRDRARALRRLGAVLDSAPVGIVELDLDGTVQLWNAGAERIFGWSEAEVLGRRNPVAADDLYWTQLDQLRRQATVRRVEGWRPRRDGTSVPVEMTTAALADDSGTPYGYLGVYVDVSHRLQLEQELRTAAFTDPLTGLANRTRFTARLDAMAQAERGASVVLLDLDGFKAVNDTLGHEAGDRVLEQVADRLRAVCRDDDLIARLGGDEFVVLLATPPESPAAERAAAALSARLVEVLAEPFDLGGREVSLGASVGLAHAPAGRADRGDAAGALLRDADVAMYAAKSEGKGRARVFEPALRNAVVERTDLVQDLHTALAQGELFLRWDPVVAVRSGRVVALEALVRWQHPTRGELLPAAFIGPAEETGLVVPLGAQVLAGACRALREWQGLALEQPLMVSVNVSPVQLRGGRLVTDVREVLRDTGVPAAGLVLELTEDVLLHDVDEAVEVLRELRALGVRVAIDDFGAGYSSLAYLRRLPADVVKVDRTLLADVDSDPSSHALLDAVLGLGRRLGLLTVVEGVERPAEWDVVRALGCDLAQGRLFSQPVLTGQVPGLLVPGRAGLLAAAADRVHG